MIITRLVWGTFDKIADKQDKMRYIPASAGNVLAPMGILLYTAGYPR